MRATGALLTVLLWRPDKRRTPADAARRLYAQHLSKGLRLVVQIVAPLLESIAPELATELISGIRAGLMATTPTNSDEISQLAVDEHLQQLADSIETRVRAKIDIRRSPGNYLPKAGNVPALLFENGLDKRVRRQMI
jgi:hypothetical protein